MPEQTDRLKELRESGEKYPYHSKSRILSYVKCPRSFEYKYLKGLREPENYAMRRGTVIHEAIEQFYYNAMDYVSTRVMKPHPDELPQLLPDHRMWQPYISYIANFLCFEARRLREASSPEAWLPVEVEGEGFVEDPLDQGPEKAIPATGYVDVIYDADSIPGILDDGKVIVDHKTGKTPDEKYRNDGIYLQGEFYAMLFEDEYNITGIAGYYPKADDLILTSPSPSRRSKVVDTMMGIEEIVREQQERLDGKEQPLCKWGTESDEQCAYYDICGASTWGEPLKHADEFRSLVEQGVPDGQIANHFGCNYGAVGYGKYKLGLN